MRGAQTGREGAAALLQSGVGGAITQTLQKVKLRWCYYTEPDWSECRARFRPVSLFGWLRHQEDKMTKVVNLRLNSGCEHPTPKVIDTLPGPERPSNSPHLPGVSLLGGEIDRTGYVH